MRASIDSFVGSGPSQMDEYKNTIRQMQHAQRVRRSQHVSTPRITMHKYQPKPTYHAPKQVYHAPKVTRPKTVSAKPTHLSTTVNATPSAPSYEDILKKQQQEYQNKINGIYDQHLSSQLAQLKANNLNATKQINGQIGDVKQQAYGNRNQADVVAQQNAQRLREVMAANGLGASGENVSANVGLNNARQLALNNINTQEQQNVGQLQNQIADINNPDRMNALKQQIESERSQALAGAMQQANDNAWRQYAYNNMSAAQKAQLAQDASQFGENMAWQNYALKYNGNLQMAQNQAALNAYTGFNSSSGGGDYQSNLAQAVKLAHIPANQLGAFNWIINKESSFNPKADNPNSSAYGYGQFLDSTIANYDKKTGLDYRHNPVDQLVETYKYMQDRYGGPAKAMLYWKQHGWY